MLGSRKFPKPKAKGFDIKQQQKLSKTRDLATLECLPVMACSASARWCLSIQRPCLVVDFQLSLNNVVGGGCACRAR